MLLSFQLESLLIHTNWSFIQMFDRRQLSPAFRRARSLISMQHMWHTSIWGCGPRKKTRHISCAIFPSCNKENWSDRSAKSNLDWVFLYRIEKLKDEFYFRFYVNFFNLTYAKDENTWKEFGCKNYRFKNKNISIKFCSKLMKLWKIN